MSYDENIADRVRIALRGQEDVIAKRMFGGLAFLVKGNMSCGVLGSDLVVRVGPANYPEVLKEPHTREMDFTGGTLKDLVYVGKRGIGSDDSLRTWLNRGLEFAASLPARKTGSTRKSRQRQTPSEAGRQS